MSGDALIIKCLLNSCLCFSDALSANDEPEFLYYMNDGVYGSFAGKLLCEDSISMPSAHKVGMSLFLLN